jgi:hypothetical protein|tara:strand:+ start:1046 stop:1261 length:216 start_codon:yes stop_codon:yes gene_type:complete
MENPKVTNAFSIGDKFVGINRCQIEVEEIKQSEYRLYLFPFEFQLSTSNRSIRLGFKILMIVLRFEFVYEK